MNEIVVNENKTDIRKKIYSLILPITIENILQTAGGLVSMAMIGRISPLAVGAIGISARITQIVWALFKGITTGATVFVAQAYGAGNTQKMKEVAQQTLLSTIALVFILQQIIWWNAEELLGIFNPGAEMLKSAALYLRLVSLGLPFMAVSLVVAGVLQATGNGKTPMKIAFIMNAINIVLNYAFIFGKFGFSAYGIQGAALALAISQFASAILGLYVLFSRNGLLNSIRIKYLLKPDIKQILAVYKVGIPSSFESIFWQLATIILTRAMLTFGETAFAAYQLGLQAESISYMPAIGFGVAATAFVGQSLGQRSPELGKIYMKEIIKGSVAITGVSTFILVFAPDIMMSVLTNNKEVISLGAKYLILMGFVQIPQNLSGVWSGALRGAGFTKAPMVVAGTGLWLIRVPFALLLTYHFHMSIIAIWSVMSIDMLFRSVISYIIYKKSDIYNRKTVF